MIVKNDTDIDLVPVTMEGATNVKMAILIGSDEKSSNIVMRLFHIEPGGHTPYHSHPYEHVVRIISGTGAIKDADGTSHSLSPGQSVFVPPNEKHQFMNTSTVVLKFICVIPAL